MTPPKPKEPQNIFAVIPPEAVCVDCGLVRGPAYPEEPTVRVRADGKARCADCNNKFAHSN